MSIVCKMCGATATPGATKCDFCGHTEFIEKVPQRSAPQPATIPQNPGRVSPALGLAKRDFDHAAIFNAVNWREAWRRQRADSRRLGLILTNTETLENTAPFFSALEDFYQFKAQEGIDYCLLDLASQEVMPLGILSCSEIIKLLSEVYGVAVPDYLFIIGDINIVPAMVWDNKCDPKYDKTVSADLPYITLDTDSPWSGKIFDFSRATPVGRVPTSGITGFSEAIEYLRFEMQRGYSTEIKAFAYSAEDWVRTAHTAFDHLKPDVITSPIYTVHSQYAEKYKYRMLNPLNAGYNVLSFILHGSEGDHYWYGQRNEAIYPPAFSPNTLPIGSQNGYVLSTGACYGAKPIIRSQGDYSILVKAMANRCLAFVGSTRVAYGNGNGYICCADIIGSAFIKDVAKGVEFGEAYLDAITRLVKTTDMDETDIKTLAEFALYGDPSATLLPVSREKAFAPRAKRVISRPANDRSRAISLMPCTGTANGQKSLVSPRYRRLPPRARAMCFRILNPCPIPSLRSTRSLVARATVPFMKRQWTVF